MYLKVARTDKSGQVLPEGNLKYFTFMKPEKEIIFVVSKTVKVNEFKKLACERLEINPERVSLNAFRLIDFLGTRLRFAN